MTKTISKRFANPIEPVKRARKAATPGEPAPTSKIEQVIAMLRRPHGARISELTATTGWKTHTVRGAISGAIRGKRKLTVTTDLADGVTVYCIRQEAP